MNIRVSLGIVSLAALLTGCSSQDVPQAHKGRMFDKTGAAAFYVGGRGFEGPILGPGTYYTGIYPEVRMVDCAQRTVKDKAIAERERVTAEIETTKMRQQLVQNEASNDVAKIDAIGGALKRNPEFLQYDAQQRWNDIFYHAGEKGNMIIAAPSPQVILTPMQKK